MTIERTYDTIDTMSAIPVVASVATLAVADPASCDRAALGELAAAALRVRGWLDAFEASLAAQAAHSPSRPTSSSPPTVGVRAATRGPPPSGVTCAS